MKGKVVVLLITIILVVIQWPLYLQLNVQDYPMINRGVAIYALDDDYQITGQVDTCDGIYECMTKICTVYHNDTKASHVVFDPLRRIQDLHSCDLQLSHLDSEHLHSVFMGICIMLMCLLAIAHTIALFIRDRLIIVTRDKVFLLLLAIWFLALFIILVLFEGLALWSMPLQSVLPMYITQIVITGLAFAVIAIYWTRGFQTSIYEILDD